MNAITETLTEKITVTEALTRVNEYLKQGNAGCSDKVVLFYRITPYANESGYINWILASKYSARNQMMGVKNVRTPWYGTPSSEHFLEDFLSVFVELRARMTREITHARGFYEDITILDGYRASDEVDKLDEIFV